MQVLFWHQYFVQFFISLRNLAGSLTERYKHLKYKHFVYPSAILGRLYEKDVLLFGLVLCFGVDQRRAYWPNIGILAKSLFVSIFIGTQPGLFVYMLSVRAFLPRQQSGVVVTEMVGPTKPKLVSLWSCAEKTFASTCCTSDVGLQDGLGKVDCVVQKSNFWFYSE